MEKDLRTYLRESLEDKVDKLEKQVKDAETKAEDAQNEADKAKKEATKAEDSIKTEKDFRSYAENKFKEVFGDDLDEKKMNEIIDGILKDNKEDADKGDWGKLVGILNKSFGH